MTKQPVEIIRSSYEAMNNLDFDAVLSVVSSDVVVVDPTRPDPSSADGKWRGKEGWGRFLLDWADSFEDTQYEAVEVVSLGDVVVAEVRVRGRGRGSGIPVENTRFHVFTFRNGEGIRLEVCVEREEALSAAKSAAENLGASAQDGSP